MHSNEGQLNSDINYSYKTPKIYQLIKDRIGMIHNIIAGRMGEIGGMIKIGIQQSGKNLIFRSIISDVVFNGLKSTNSEHNELIESVAIVLFDKEGNIEYANSNFLKAAGIRSEEELNELISTGTFFKEILDEESYEKNSIHPTQFNAILKFKRTGKSFKWINEKKGMNFNGSTMNIGINIDVNSNYKYLTTQGGNMPERIFGFYNNLHNFRNNVKSGVFQVISNARGREYIQVFLKALGDKAIKIPLQELMKDQRIKQIFSKVFREYDIDEFLLKTLGKENMKKSILELKNCNEFIRMLLNKFEDKEIQKNFENLVGTKKIRKRLKRQSKEVLGIENTQVVMQNYFSARKIVSAIDILVNKGPYLVYHKNEADIFANRQFFEFSGMNYMDIMNGLNNGNFKESLYGRTQMEEVERELYSIGIGEFLEKELVMTKKVVKKETDGFEDALNTGFEEEGSKVRILWNIYRYDKNSFFWVGLPLEVPERIKSKYIRSEEERNRMRNTLYEERDFLSFIDSDQEKVKVAKEGEIKDDVENAFDDILS